MQHIFHLQVTSHFLCCHSQSLTEILQNYINDLPISKNEDVTGGKSVTE
jgi:hypothetical protein